MVLKRLRWQLYKRAVRWYPNGASMFQPRFADKQGHNVHWFAPYCVERRAGGGYVEVGSDCRIEGRLICHRANSRILVGSRTSIGGGTVVESLGIVCIGDDCLVSHHCAIQDHDSHAVEWEHRQDDVLDWLVGRKDWTHVAHADVVIGSKCWIGTRCIILKGVHLGEGTVVAAGSVVTRSCPPYSLLAGNPAKVVRIMQVQVGSEITVSEQLADYSDQ